MQSRFHEVRSYLNSREQALAAHDGLSFGWQLLVFGLVLAAVFSRCSTLLTHAQFYAEDGAVWYAQAYNGGWLHSLTLPEGGYLNTLQRLGAGLALLVPLRWAPLVMAIIGMLIQTLPVMILISPRCRNWAPLPTRVLLAAIYLAIPIREIHVVLTNSQWHLALAAVLLAFASRPQGWPGRLFDCVLFLTAGFSGPFCVVLAPLVLLFWWLRRQPWSLVILALMSIGAFTQAVGVLLHSGVRTQGPLGAGPEPLLRILGGNVVGDAIFGGFPLSSLAPIVLLAPAAIGGLCIYLYCLRSANLEWKLFLVYCAAIFTASLYSPLIGGSQPLWYRLVDDPSARYWFFPMLAFAWSAVWCALYAPNRFFKLAGTCIFLTMSIGIVRDWQYGGYADVHFAVSVQRMQNAKPGEHVIMPVVPEGTHMELIKKGI
jgi:hypothetical protein